jgi:hypothetical protein
MGGQGRIQHLLQDWEAYRRSIPMGEYPYVLSRTNTIMHLTEVEVASIKEGQALIQLMLGDEVWVSPNVITDRWGRHTIKCGLEANQAALYLIESKKKL